MEETSLHKALKEFDAYVHDLRNDWSDFDGRDLLEKWNETIHKIYGKCNKKACRENHFNEVD